MMRVGIREVNARFQSDFILEIKDKVKLLPFNDLNDLFQLEMRIEKKLREYLHIGRTTHYLTP